MRLPLSVFVPLLFNFPGSATGALGLLFAATTDAVFPAAVPPQAASTIPTLPSTSHRRIGPPSVAGPRAGTTQVTHKRIGGFELPCGSSALGDWFVEHWFRRPGAGERAP